ncbi:MAG: NAD(P)H-dependent oxidoreductase [Clostridia bacterium]|nr:NAD(P)H-dependent oxidoreductase [Clostridia bacterium]
MRNVLFVDCCIRGEQSRTWDLAQAFLSALPADCEVTHLRLTEQALQPLTGEYFEARQKLLDAGQKDHPRFFYAHQFQQADLIVIAAPFWDLAFPALLKIYIEQISVDGITFCSTAQGLTGLCKAADMVYLTTRGGFYTDDSMEMGSRYMQALCKFYGTGNYHCIAADGMDVAGFDGKGSLEQARQEARALAAKL